MPPKIKFAELAPAGGAAAQPAVMKACGLLQAISDKHTLVGHNADAQMQAVKDHFSQNLKGAKDISVQIALESALIKPTGITNREDLTDAQQARVTTVHAFVRDYDLGGDNQPGGPQVHVSKAELGASTFRCLVANTVLGLVGPVGGPKCDKPLANMEQSFPPSWLPQQEIDPCGHLMLVGIRQNTDVEGDDELPFKWSTTSDGPADAILTKMVGRYRFRRFGFSVAVYLHRHDMVRKGKEMASLIFYLLTHKKDLAGIRQELESTKPNLPQEPAEWAKSTWQHIVDVFDEKELRGPRQVKPTQPKELEQARTQLARLRQENASLKAKLNKAAKGRGNNRADRPPGGKFAKKDKGKKVPRIKMEDDDRAEDSEESE